MGSYFQRKNKSSRSQNRGKCRSRSNSRSWRNRSPSFSRKSWQRSRSRSPRWNSRSPQVRERRPLYCSSPCPSFTPSPVSKIQSQLRIYPRSPRSRTRSESCRSPRSRTMSGSCRSPRSWTRSRSRRSPYSLTRSISRRSHRSWTRSNSPRVKYRKKTGLVKEAARDKPERLQLAKEDVLSGYLSQRGTAKEYNIPRTTLQDFIKAPEDKPFKPSI